MPNSILRIITYNVSLANFLKNAQLEKICIAKCRQEPPSTQFEKTCLPNHISVTNCGWIYATESHSLNTSMELVTVLNKTAHGYDLTP